VVRSGRLLPMLTRLLPHVRSDEEWEEVHGEEAEAAIVQLAQRRRARAAPAAEQSSGGGKASGTSSDAEMEELDQLGETCISLASNGVELVRAPWRSVARVPRLRVHARRQALSSLLCDRSSGATSLARASLHATIGSVRAPATAAKSRWRGRAQGAFALPALCAFRRCFVWQC
jgi:hypothetical protein